MRNTDHRDMGERYAHLAADPFRRASDEISSAIAKAMEGTNRE
jgi:hypothetical protein